MSMSEATWTCHKCQEVHEATFDACWSCGESRPRIDSAGPFRGHDEPTEDATEIQAEEQGEVAAREAVPLEERILKRFKCAKCDSNVAATRRIATTGTGLSKILDIQHNHFVAVSCQNCGFTELFDPKVLEGQPLLSSIFDVIFG